MLCSKMVELVKEAISAFWIFFVYRQGGSICNYIIDVLIFELHKDPGILSFMCCNLAFKDSSMTKPAPEKEF